MTDHRIVSLAQMKGIPLRARVRFSQFGMTLAEELRAFRMTIPCAMTLLKMCQTAPTVSSASARHGEIDLGIKAQLVQ